MSIDIIIFLLLSGFARSNYTVNLRNVSQLQIKPLNVLPFRCGSQHCPKHQDVLPFKLKKDVWPEIHDNFNYKGCSEYHTVIFGVSDQARSEVEWNAAPIYGVVLPNPDPTGAQGMGGGFGISRDIIIESFWRVSNVPAIRIAFFFITRGYSIKPFAYKRELQPKPINPSAISFCTKYLIQDIATVKPEKLLLCGPEVGQIFFSGQFTVPDFRRLLDLTVRVGNDNYDAQVTFNPHICTTNPAYLKIIWDDCRKLFEKPERMRKRSVKILRTLDAVVEYLDFLSSFDGYCAIDYETENLNRTGNNRIATIQFATDADEAMVLPLYHRETPFSPDELQLIFGMLQELFRKKNNLQGWIAHGAKFENTISKLHFGTMLRSAPIFDTQAMFFLLDETRSERKADLPSLKGHMGPFTLKLLAKDFLFFYEYDEEVLALREDGALFDLSLDRLADYGGMDAYVTYALFERAIELAIEQDYTEQMFKMCAMYYGPATLLCAHVETTGFKVNLKKARELSANKGPYELLISELTDKMKELPMFQEANRQIAAKKNAGSIKSAWGEVPWVFDFSKPDQQRLAFFSIGGFEPVSWGDKSGEPSVDDVFFKEYRKEYPEVELFAQYAETKKLRDTFVNKIMQRIDPQTGDPDSKKDQRIRPGIQYTKLVTGRWAMTKPNLQQLPRSEEGADESTGKFYVRKSIKDMFTVDPGYGLIQVDYKVNEVRWAAILAQDEVMAGIFQRAAKQLKAALETGNLDDMKLAELMEDIHRNTASEAFGVPLAEVVKKQRQAAKTITFGILFGQGIDAIAQAIGSTPEEAEEFQRKFFARMKGIENLIARMKNDAQTKGFVEGPHGRRRRFWSYYLPDSYPGKRKWAARNERQSVNSPIQGVASDAAMVGGAYNFLEYIWDNDKDWKIQNLVHDSCIFQVPMHEVAEAIMILESIFVDKAMEHMTRMGVKFNLPLGIDIEAGHILWGSLEKWKGTREHAEALQQKVVEMWA